MERAPQITLIHRETRALVLLVAIAVAAFVMTRAVARANQARRHRDAQAWSSRGEASLRRGDTAAAAQQLRRASALDPSSLEVRLALAEALTSAHAIGDARAVLTEARASAPDNASANLALGRLEAAHGEKGAAIGAYQTALNALWRPADAAARYQVRTELVRYLLARGERSRALSELLIISADMPDTALAHAEAGTMFAAAGEPSRALDQLEKSLALDRTNQSVQFSAGEAALAAGDDARALRHLRAAGDLTAARELASVVTLAVSHDPLLPRLPSAERERRLRAGLQQVRGRLEGCAASPADTAASPLLNEIDRFESSLAPGKGRRATPVADLVDDGVELIARAEAQAVACGPATPLDQALTLIGRRHQARS
jgi:tetratricopeptide (TPR) repeat protein